MKVRMRARPAEARLEVRLRSTGRKRWNMTRDYALAYSPEALIRERTRFDRIFLIEMHLGVVGGDARRQLILNLASGRSESQVELKYERFLIRLFESIVQVEQFLLGIPERHLHAFLFHLGILNYYRLVRSYLDAVDSGRLHSIQRNIMLRHLPVHFIRKTLMEWWEAKVLNGSFEADNEMQARELCALVSLARRKFAARVGEAGPLVTIPHVRFRRLHQEILLWSGDAPQKR
jgi:hypothetical protein